MKQSEAEMLICTKTLFSKKIIIKNEDYYKNILIGKNTKISDFLITENDKTLITCGSNCISSKCISWVKTKTHREMTYAEQKRYEEYEKKVHSVFNSLIGIRIISESEKDSNINEELASLKEEYKDVVDINLELPDYDKEGYCHLYSAR